MLDWTVLAAQTAKHIDSVIVSSDDSEILAHAESLGAVAHRRSAETARDHVHSVHVVLEVLDWLEAEHSGVPHGIAMLLPTSPLRCASHIEGAASLFLKGADSVISVADTGKLMTNMRWIRDGVLVPVDRQENPNAQRQEAEPVYAVNGSIYIARPDVVRTKKTFHIDGAMAYVMPALQSIDINRRQDLELVDALMKSGIAKGDA